MCSLAVGASRSRPAVVSRPVASFRSRPDPRSELLTQEVFGRPIRVETLRGDWARCIARDGTRGWLPQTYFCRRGGFKPGHRVCTRFAPLEPASGTPLELPMGSLLEVKGGRGGARQVALPGGGSGRIAAASLARIKPGRAALDGLPAAIQQVLGTPYLWGGSSTFGFDCSGLVRFLFDIFGIRLPRNSSDQAGSGRRVRIESAAPLDLFFFGSGPAGNHGAIHLGNLSILHASGDVRVESLDPASPVFRKDLALALTDVRRVVR